MHVIIKKMDEESIKNSNQPTSSKITKPLLVKLSELFGIDLRSLALFRIGLAVILLYDLVDRATSLRAHYTDFGVLPLSAFLDYFASPWNVSLHFISGRLEIQAFLFVVAGLFAIAFLVGWHTRLFTFLSWLFCISLQNRNPMVGQAGDILLRLLLFWGIFLPLGARYSVDSINKPSQSTSSTRVLSVASVALLLQVCLVYWFAALLKDDAIWRSEGTAIYYALNLEQYVTAFGHLLLQFPSFLKVATFLTLGLEAFGPLLMFFPFYYGPVRCVVIVLFALLHLSFALCFKIGPFPFISMVSWIPFLPSFFWGKFFGRFSSLVAFGIKTRTFVNARLAVKSSVLKSFGRPNVFSYFLNLLIGFLLIYVFLWNLNSVISSKNFIPSKIKWIGQLLRLDQEWDMFAPFPLKDDGWYVIPGKLKDGTEVELLTGNDTVSWEKPALISNTFKNYRWKKYMVNLWLKRNEDHRLFYGKYLCRQWNEQHQGDKQLDSFEIYYMLERTPAPGQQTEIQKRDLWEHYCYED